MASRTRTFASKLCAAELCRRNGWGRGTVLVSAGTPPRRIEITAVGDDEILAWEYDCEGKFETTWELRFDDWRTSL